MTNIKFKAGMTLQGKRGQRCYVSSTKEDSATILFTNPQGETVKANVPLTSLQDFEVVK